MIEKDMTENIPKGDMRKMMREEDMTKREKELNEKNIMIGKEVMIESVEKGITEKTRPEISEAIVQAIVTVVGALHGTAADIWRENEKKRGTIRRNITEKNMKRGVRLKDEDSSMSIDVASLENIGAIVGVIMMLKVKEYSGHQVRGHQVEGSILKKENILEAGLVQYKNLCLVRN